MFDTFRDMAILEEENSSLKKEVKELKERLKTSEEWLKRHQETECEDGLIDLVVRQAELRGAQWMHDWFWQQGLRHHSANPASVCDTFRKKDAKS